MSKNIVILISGRGSNMQAIVQANIPGIHIAAIISNDPDALGLRWAKEQGIHTIALNHQDFPTRAEFDLALQHSIDQFSPELVVLAGFMRILSESFTQHFAHKLINIHPSLLPSFTGLHTHQRAIDMGCKIAGCTVHFVTAQLDYGPIITQAVVPILPEDTEECLANRVLKMEHQIYPQAIADFIGGHLTIKGMQVHNSRTHLQENGAIYS
ncbi:phosphoribosylglycinamide formyltransferase [Neisseria sp. Ec49-e6-T10]|uniref:phosphoribosylglycinamide formyltransferase n=1 Tax=Neisseria sp. Ec49-e6-T10 TaxID=3140744 RepID=UPI003EBDFF2A